MAQTIKGIILKEMPMQDDVEIVGERPPGLRLIEMRAKGVFLESAPTEDSSERPTCFDCGSSSCLCTL